MAMYCYDFALLEPHLGLNGCMRFDRAEGEKKMLPVGGRLQPGLLSVM